MNKKINWEHLARQLNSIRLNPDGDNPTLRTEAGGSDLAKKALAILLGDELVCNAVDWYVSGQPGCELARSVLWLIKPAAAIDHCYAIYKSDAALENKISAIELLRIVADKRVIAWIPKFLQDPNKEIQSWGAGIVDQILQDQIVEIEEVAEVLSLMKAHPNEQVRVTSKFILENFGSDE